ncbi:hypothetical protein D3C87_1932710 [compost metagenome]
MGQQNLLGAAVARAAHAHAAFGLVELGFQDDVDDAAHRVGAVEGGRPVQQYVHPRDRAGRDVGDIGEVAGDPGAGDPPTVDQDEGRVRAETAQV